MARRLCLCGTTTTRTGTEEAYWLIVLDADMSGINRTAKVKDAGDTVSVMFRDGMNTYIGVASKAKAGPGPWPCRGLFYHDDDGGPAGTCPRGTFNLRMYDLAGAGRCVVFDGSYSDDAVSGSHFSLAAEIADPASDRRPVGNTVGQWDEEQNMLTVCHGRRLYVGRWATSMSHVNKWSGVYFAPREGAPDCPGLGDFDLAGMPVGTFLLYPTELTADE
eukprot:TRINITY_DN18724_c0_g2_i1.p1 TRINITY_DN18724_c0_g2~~TRINITY_DN18724_c0_g2_i1.p1  ORF type:complete len:219 (+),score=56.31 TRINITY_DN18724_c0_g2_i1:83-739(+)